MKKLRSFKVELASKLMFQSRIITLTDPVLVVPFSDIPDDDFSKQVNKIDKLAHENCLQYKTMYLPGGNCIFIHN